MKEDDKWYDREDQQITCVPLFSFININLSDNLIQFFILVCHMNSQMANKIKLSVTPCRRQREEEVWLILIIDFGIRGGEWTASRYGRALALGKGPPVPIGYEAGWTSELAWTQRLQEEFLANTNKYSLYNRQKKLKQTLSTDI
jgi:hypothetical protein